MVLASAWSCSGLLRRLLLQHGSEAVRRRWRRLAACIRWSLEEDGWFSFLIMESSILLGFQSVVSECRGCAAASLESHLWVMMYVYQGCCHPPKLIVVDLWVRYFAFFFQQRSLLLSALSLLTTWLQKVSPPLSSPRSVELGRQRFHIHPELVPNDDQLSKSCLFHQTDSAADFGSLVQGRILRIHPPGIISLNSGPVGSQISFGAHGL